MTESMRCELVSWERFHDLARGLAFAMHRARFHPELIVAIGRGGYMPARLVSDYLDIYDLTDIRIEHYHGAHMQRVARVRYPLATDIAGKRVLLIDDVNDSGDTFETAIQHLREHGEPAQIRTAVLHHKSVSTYRSDFYAEEVTEWRWIIYPWAVVEDVSALVNKLDLAQRHPNAVAEQLEQAYGIRLSREVLGDVLALMRTARRFSGD